MCNPLWLTALCHEWPANMYSRRYNLAVRSGWSFIPYVRPCSSNWTIFWAALYHLTLSQSRRAALKKFHFLNENSKKPVGSFLLRIWGGRRKGSGSYYTPQAITTFLVKD